MDSVALNAMISERKDSLSKQLRIAAQYVLDNVAEVVGLSLREQAKKAGVLPATMTRLAKELGFEGYDGIRKIYANAVRDSDLGFSNYAKSFKNNLRDEKTLGLKMLQAIAAHVEEMQRDETLGNLSAAAYAIASARRVYCLSLRSIHPVAWYLHYIVNLVSEKSVFLESIGGAGLDALARANSDDVIFLASVEPYSRATIEIAETVARKGLTIIAVTDVETSPLARLANYTIYVPTSSPASFRTMTPAFLAAEVLSALVIALESRKSMRALAAVDDHLEALGTHIRPPRKVEK